VFVSCVVFWLTERVQAATPAAAELGPVDFRYAPPWWQTAICLPDDSDKMLVGREGQLLLDFGGGGGRNFGICIQPELEGGTTWIRQQTVSPRAPIIQTRKEDDGVEVLGETFVVTPGAGPARRTVVLVTLRNHTLVAVTRCPVLRIHSVGPVSPIRGDGSIGVGDGTRISASVRIEACTAVASNTFLLRLPKQGLKPAEMRQVVFTIDRDSPKPAGALSTAKARRLRDEARKWWEKKSGLPFDTIQVPDAGIQGMIESCVRNIWQAREIKNGKPAFHVGPTVYRGLWVVDGSFILESAALLGRGREARAGIEYLLSHQKPDGSFELLNRYWKENGIVLWAVTRHAFLTQDKAWLRSKWPALQQVVGAIKRLRAETSKDAEALNFGLLPAGLVDGGIGGTELDFSNTEWCLGGLKAAIGAAHWLGDEATAIAWQREYDDFFAMFRRACQRDLRKDAFGNDYVPALLGNAGKLPPQKGQWSFCHAVYPGQIFPVDDALVASQMAMLRATKVEGMAFDTGWMKNGLWTYFTSFYGHAALWLGEGQEAAEALYDFANHAGPTRVWREEQKPLGKGAEEVGDMPHNWASAEFIRLTVHLLELDRGDELHLLEGMPANWLKAGMKTRLQGVATPFGPLNLTVQVARDGGRVKLDLKPLAANCNAVVVHLPDGSLRRLPPQRPRAISFPVPKKTSIESKQ